MQAVELPRTLEDYFAHCELPDTPDGRRFSITLPYFDGPRLDRVQWWWNLPASQQKFQGESAFAAMRRQAIERFSRHIERWLCNNGKRLFGDGPIPQLGNLEGAPAAPVAAPSADAPVPQPSLRRALG
jgi:hypothetical protein